MFLPHKDWVTHCLLGDSFRSGVHLLGRGITQDHLCTIKIFERFATVDFSTCSAIISLYSVFFVANEIRERKIFDAGQKMDHDPDRGRTPTRLGHRTSRTCCPTYFSWRILVDYTHLIPLAHPPNGGGQCVGMALEPACCCLQAYLVQRVNYGGMLLRNCYRDLSTRSGRDTGSAPTRGTTLPEPT